MKVFNYLEYNSIIILSFFFISLLVLILNRLTKGKSNDLLFSTYRSNPFNPLTYLRLITHIFGHANWQHFTHNFLYILLIGPMIEEKYGSINLLIMIATTSLIIGIINSIFTKNKILGASSITFMLIFLSSFVNFSLNKIPLTFILICIFYVIDEIKFFGKKDSISHGSHFIGAIAGFVFGYIIFPA